MKQKSPISRLAGWLALALSSATAINAADAPTATGVIEGRVLNSVRGDYVERARVTVDGTPLETFSETDGSYRLTNVPAGPVTVKAFFTGVPEQAHRLNVTAGQTARHDFDLSASVGGQSSGSGVVRLGEFTVSASRDMDSAAIAINEQRFAPNTKNVVSTDEFGNVAEGSVGEFLKYLPGVTMDFEAGALARGVSINGVPSSHVPITVGEFSLASGGGNNVTGRSVQLDMLSITNMSRMEVEYSPTPESQGAALAGTVKMVPRSAFERTRPLLNVNAYISMRDNARDFHKSPGPFETPTRKVHPGFDFSYVRPVNSNFGFTLSGGHSRNGTKEEFILNTWRGVASATNGNAFPHTTPDRPYLTSTQVRDGTKDARRASFGATVDYKFTPYDRLSFSLQYSEVNLLVMNRTIVFNITRVAPDGFTPTATRGAPGAGDLQLSNTYRDRHNKTLTPTLVWRHDGLIWKSETGLGWSRGTNANRAIDKGYFTTTTGRRTGATIAFSDIFYLRPATITVTDAGGAPLDPYKIDNYVLASSDSRPLDNVNLKRTFYANLRRDFYGRLPLTLKAGIDLRHDLRDQRGGTVQYNYGGADGRATTEPAAGDDRATPFFAPNYSQRTPAFGFPRVQWLDNEKVWKRYQTNPNEFTINANNAYRSDVNGSKHTEELVSAAYLRGDLSLLERRLKLVGGLRAEQTNIEAEGPLTDPTRNFRRDASGRLIMENGRPVSIVPASDALGISQLTLIHRGAKAEKEYLRWFPSLNASYNLTENLIARGAYYHSIGRPNFNQYAGGITLPDEALPPGPNNRIQVNNAGIKPWTARSLTTRLEYYFEGVGQVSVGAFRREFENFFGNTIFRSTPEFLALYGLDSTAYGSYDVATQHNIPGTVRMTGVDVGYKQALTFLPRFARGVQVFANGSLQRATGGDETAEFASYIPRKASWGISLSREKFNVRLNWTYQSRARGDAVAQGSSIEPGTFEWLAKRGFLDVLGEYYLTKRIALYFNLRNVGDTPEEFHIIGPSTPEHAQFRSREYGGSLWTFGIKGTF